MITRWLSTGSIGFCAALVACASLACASLALAAESPTGESVAQPQEIEPRPSEFPAQAQRVQRVESLVSPQRMQSAAAPQRVKAPAAAAEPASAHADHLQLDTTVVTGNRELPKVLYIVPWKKADIGELPGQPFNTLIDEVLTPVDRDVFRREVTYYGAVAARAGAAPTGDGVDSPEAAAEGSASEK